MIDCAHTPFFFFYTIINQDLDCVLLPTIELLDINEELLHDVLVFRDSIISWLGSIK